MPEFPVTRLFDRVGCVYAERDGLYLNYRAVQEAPLPARTCLYYHGPAGTQRLGLFFQEEEGPVSRGRISLRRLGGGPERGSFTVTELPWQPFEGVLDGGICPERAVYREIDRGRLLVFPDGPVLPPELTPYFCFLTPERIEGLPCLTMLADRQGRPVVREISL